jgi:threonine dehydratase
LSFARREPVSHPVTTVLGDGMAVRTPDPAALEVVWRHVDRVVAVTDAELGEAMRAIFADTHNVAEGAGAAGFAALMQERDAMAGRKAGVVLCGQNVDSDVFAGVLRG